MHAEQLCGDAERDDVRELPLLGAGADRREALDVLDRAQSRADGAPDVCDGRVALEVDEHRVLVAVRDRERRRVGQPLTRQPADALDAAQLAARHRRADPVVPPQRARAPGSRDARAGSSRPETGVAAGRIAVRARRAREHHARAVVVREELGPLDRAGREHDPPRADAPDAPAALDGEDVVVVVDPRPPTCARASGRDRRCARRAR